MQESIKKFTTQISDKWKNIDKKIRIKAMIITGFLIIALGLTIYLTVRPKWIVFNSNSDVETIGQLQNAFNDAGIKSKMSQNGTAIEVQQKDVNKARVTLAEKNIPTKGFTYTDATTLNSMGMSESDKKQMYLRVRESEVARTIESIEGVVSADVKIVPIDDTVYFENDKKEASASVTLVTDKEFTSDQTLTMARLVAMSVEGLDMKNIEIVDQNANSLYSGSSKDINSFSSKEDVERQRTKETEMRIRVALSKLYDDVNVTPNLVFNWDKRTQEDLTYAKPDPNDKKGLVQKENLQTQDVINGDSASAPGVDTNNQTAPNYQTGSGTNSTYNGNSQENQYLYNESKLVTDTAEGKFIPADSTISIMVYDFINYDESQLKENNTINAQMTWEQFKADNSQKTPITIDQQVIDYINKATGIDPNNINVVGYNVPVFIDEVVKPLVIEQIILLAILALLLLLLAFGLIRKTKPEEIEEIEPELSVKDMLVTTQLEDKKEQDQLAEIDSVESEYKRQIEKFINEKPEAVAQLLRNWLSDEWE